MGEVERREKDQVKDSKIISQVPHFMLQLNSHNQERPNLVLSSSQLEIKIARSKLSHLAPHTITSHCFSHPPSTRCPPHHLPPDTPPHPTTRYPPHHTPYHQIPHPHHTPQHTPFHRIFQREGMEYLTLSPITVLEYLKLRDLENSIR